MAIHKQDVSTQSDVRAKTSAQRRVLRIVAAIALVALANRSNFAAAADNGLPTFAAVESAVTTTLARLSNRSGDNAAQSGEILSQADVQAVFEQLKKIGWNVADRTAIVGSFLPEGDVLISELRSSKGGELQSQLGKIGGGYEQLDHLARVPNGPQAIRDLTRTKDGYKLVQSMLTTRGGAELTKMLARNSQEDFSQPTGHLYTAEQLLAHLRVSYTTAAAAQPAAATHQAATVSKPAAPIAPQNPPTISQQPPKISPALSRRVQ